MSAVPSVFDRPVFARARKRCLAFPETLEKTSWGHPNFRAGKKTFCAFEMIAGRPSIAFRLPAADVKGALRSSRFFETPYGRGRWVSVWVDAAPWSAFDRLFEGSYRAVATKGMLKQLED